MFRIAKKANEIESPTGMAFSGEVEDFKTQVTFPPKGERKETSDVQGAKQSSTIAFTPQGLAKYSRTQKSSHRRKSCTSHGRQQDKTSRDSWI